MGNCVSIPKIGLVEIVLHRPVEGILKSATIKQEPSGKWTITFVSHIQIPQGQTGVPETPIGLDAGLETFVTTSDGAKTPPPKFYRKQKKKLRKAQRSFSRKPKGSRNKSKARKRVAVIHARIRNRRNDFLHKQSRKLCECHDCVCLEDLGVSALAKTKLRGHSKSWHDASWGTFRRQLTYKQRWRGQRIVAVDRFFASSQQCHVCGLRTKHDLSVQVWICEGCATLHDRDINAAKTILAEGLRKLACGNQESLNVCGRDIRLPKRKQLRLKQKSSNREIGSPRL